MTSAAMPIKHKIPNIITLLFFCGCLSFTMQRNCAFVTTCDTYKLFAIFFEKIDYSVTPLQALQALHVLQRYKRYTPVTL